MSTQIEIIIEDLNLNDPDLIETNLEIIAATYDFAPTMIKELYDLDHPYSIEDAGKALVVDEYGSKISYSDKIARSGTADQMSGIRSFSISGDASGHLETDWSEDSNLTNNIELSVNYATESDSFKTPKTIRVIGDASGEIQTDFKNISDLDIHVKNSDTADSLTYPSTVRYNGDVEAELVDFDGSQDHLVSMHVYRSDSADKLTHNVVINTTPESKIQGQINLDDLSEDGYTASFTVEDYGHKHTISEVDDLSEEIARIDNTIKTNDEAIRSEYVAKIDTTRLNVSGDSTGTVLYSAGDNEINLTLDAQDYTVRSRQDQIDQLPEDLDSIRSDKISRTESVTYTLEGGVTGTVTATADSDVTIQTTVTDDSHQHGLSTLPEVQQALSDLSEQSDADFVRKTTSETIKLVGDVSGSVTATKNDSEYSINVTVKDDLHNHVIDNIDGLQTELDSKTNNTDPTTYRLIGDVQGELVSDKGAAVYEILTSVQDDSHNHTDINTLPAAKQAIDSLSEQVETDYVQKILPLNLILGGDVDGSFQGTHSDSNINLTVTVKDNLHNHIIDNVDGLAGIIQSINSSLVTLDENKVNKTHKITITLDGDTKGTLILDLDSNEATITTRTEIDANRIISGIISNDRLNKANNTGGYGIVTLTDNTDSLLSNVATTPKGVKTLVDSRFNDLETRKIDKSVIGQAGGIVPLDSNRLIDPAYLPDSVDEILEYPTREDFPELGKTKKVYIALDTMSSYRWSGSVYVKLNDAVSTAETATRLETPRKINNVSFDGTNDININLNNTIQSGSGIAAFSFNGSQSRSISVDSTVVRTSDPRLTDKRDPNAHVHPISDITGLQSSLNSKFDKSGGTVNGNVIIDGGNLKITTVDDSETWLRYGNDTNTNANEVGFRIGGVGARPTPDLVVRYGPNEPIFRLKSTGELTLTGNLNIGSSRLKIEGKDVIGVAGALTRFGDASGGSAVRIISNSAANLSIQVGSNLYKIYNEGSKPTASEVGAVSKSGDTMTGDLTVTRGGGAELKLTAIDNGSAPSMTGQIVITGYGTRGKGTFYKDSSITDEWFSGVPYSALHKQFSIGYSSTGAQSEYVANLLFTVKSDGTLLAGNNRIYHQGYKPTATDVGLSNLSKTTVNALRITSDYGYTNIGMMNGTWTHFETNSASGFYFQGAVRAATSLVSQDIIANGTLNVSGTTTLRDVFARRGLFTTIGLEYGSGAIEIRGGGSADPSLYPSIGFHQPGIYGGSLQQINSRTFAFRDINNNDFNDLEIRDLRCRNTFASAAVAATSAGSGAKLLATRSDSDGNINIAFIGPNTTTYLGRTSDGHIAYGTNGDITGSGSKIYSTTNKPTYSDVGIEDRELVRGVYLGTANLNDLSDGGFYYQTQNIDATPERNYPSAAAGSLFIQRAAGGVTQTYTTYPPGANRVYVRSNYNGAWGPWVQMYSQFNKPTASDVGAVAKAGDTMTGNLAVVGSVESNTGFYSDLAANFGGSWTHTKKGLIDISGGNATQAYTIWSLENGSGVKMKALGGSGGLARLYTSATKYTTFADTYIESPGYIHLNDGHIESLSGGHYGSHGSISISGTKGNYAGIHFNSVNRTLMIGGGVQGIHDGTNWQWYFSNGTLTAGTVPFARVSGNVPWARIDNKSVQSTRWPTFEEITGKPAQSTRWPTFEEITGKPTTFTPSAHTHGGHDIKTLGNRLTVNNDGSIVKNSTAHRNAGIYGIYDSTKFDQIWSMGEAYKIAPDGSSLNNLYGLAYGYEGANANYSGGHQLFWVNNGQINVALGSGGVWTRSNMSAYSDIRVKTNIEKIDNALDKIVQIGGYTYTRTDLEDTETRHSGVIAQEVQKILPEVVSEISDGNNGTHLSVNYSGIIPLLIEGIKEQNTLLEEQKTLVEDQSNEIENLKQELNTLKTLINSLINK
ncbi:pyocin knob domain-containing S74 family peptidase [Shewanella sp. SE1]|uniref:pyocin knob domain-containing S74 family peptidase n=1 Tax=Shewanella sp. SE1 TaxID=2705014 RepID=UPI00138EC9F2|nr:pyocin knob domain-containing S74 family peptidase [Shewanella sp. SE1]NDO73076.1 hypothetical protein [Shewanella sp. SE1]